ncbi:hypothetical protein [Cellulomonas marina]|uniref:Uncharacterized protein n=1 Tax=Cellulomonas marina TaxID=988821 RepID=A0A1I0ZW72_9CELL|nr:hypothetical protein [Cellulomonas marina]GIG29412.1 hypothetical protein Cma02nite_20120 [Cellulomonas marina]SFB30009.1 hypothetical protein SAMN05421867_11354 [Cellulomonas marina]
MGPAVETYRFLRLGVAGLVLLLLLALVLLRVTGAGAHGGTVVLDSISAAYWTPVRDVLVGVLVATGTALLAIRGRRGTEDGLLNLAGLLAPVVGLAPTPLAADDPRCAGRRCLPPGAAEAVGVQVAALLVVGTVLLVVTALVQRRRRGSPGRTQELRWTAVAALVWAALTVWFVLGRPSFLLLAHWVAAVALFGLVAGVAALNARAVRTRVSVRALRPGQYAGAYAAIAVGMAGTVVAAALLAGAQAVGLVDPPRGTVLVVELVLLLLFAAFWVLQTAENWEEGVPPGAAG